MHAHRLRMLVCASGHAFEFGSASRHLPLRRFRSVWSAASTFRPRGSRRSLFSRLRPASGCEKVCDGRLHLQTERVQCSLSRTPKRAALSPVKVWSHLLWRPRLFFHLVHTPLTLFTSKPSPLPPPPPPPPEGSRISRRSLASLACQSTREGEGRGTHAAGELVAVTGGLHLGDLSRRLAVPIRELPCTGPHLEHAQVSRSGLVLLRLAHLILESEGRQARSSAPMRTVLMLNTCMHGGGG
jgi:hypothetical protein